MNGASACLILVLLIAVAGLGALAACYYREAEQRRNDLTGDIRELVAQVQGQVHCWVLQDQRRVQAEHRQQVT